ncbi:hypothetical protein OC846_001935 [Tilletia horrida]|uniref:Uncharacterized protein n=1 Tax=Tilletia horrida TaxID=155126 RepID=A0AAN6GUH9_9BASI|nr:hypothetical protein OC845_002031 [Tilletia horrida]KAK0554832.1 hypothetical protein OC846_001935 [Tilletia horrida]KAK0568178.1 hypothetical protein OC861_002197 [Tilletia horrida]
MSALPADLASAASATPRSTISNSASTSLVTGGNGPAPIALDLRPTSLHESALSPAEHAVFPIWLTAIKAAPSGQPGLYDEQDALTFLRRDCGVDMEDEIQILSLFERTPRGMTAGHLYALMRLASWVKAGQTPSRRLLFTQAPPLKLRKVPPVSPPKPIALKADAAIPARYPTAAPFQASAATTLQRSTTAMASSSRDVLGSQSQFEARNKPTPALPPAAALSTIGPTPGITPHPPIPSAAYTPRPGVPSVMPTPAPAPVQSGVDALLGFDPAPNPFKQAAGSAQLKQPQQFQIAPAPPPRPQQPRIVKPTPVVASAAGASNPFRSASMSIPRSAPMYGVSVSGQSDRSNGSGAQATQAGQGPFANPGDYSYSAVAAVAAAAQAAAANRPAEQAEPPLPPRSSFGGGEAAALGQLIQTAAPPPLPARVHPLIQAGLYASSEVRKRKEALPPKTFSVIQSSRAAPSKGQPRLLTGEAAPKDVVEMLPPPQHLASAKKRAAAAAAAGGTTTPFSQRGTESRRSVSDVQAFLRRHSEQDADGNPLAISDLGRTRSRGATSGIGPSDDGVPTAVAGAHGAATVVPGSTSGAKTTLLGNPATYAPKASYAHVSKTKASLPAWLREQEELQRSALLSDDPERPPTNPRSPFSAAHTHHVRSQSTSHHTPSSSNGHGRRSFHATGGSAANRNSMISALDSAVLEDGEDEDVDEEEEDFVDAPTAKLDSVAIGGDEISEKARSAATSIERPHNPFSERALGKGHPSTTLVTEPGGANLARPLGRSKTLHGKGPPPPPPAPPRRRLDSSPATAIEPPDFAPSSRTALPPPPQRSPTADLKRAGSTRVSSAASHGRYPTDEGSVRVNAKRTNSMSWRRSGDQSPTEGDGSARGGLGSNAGTTGSQRAGVGANIKEKVSDLFRQTMGADGPLSRDYSGSNGNGETGGGGFGSFLTKPSPKGERPLDLLQQDIAAVVERHSWLSRAAEKAKGRPITEGRRGLMSERDDDDEVDEDRRHHHPSKFSDGPQPDRDASFDDDDVAPDTTEEHRPPPPVPRRSGTFRRSAIDDPAPGEIGAEQSPFGDSNRTTEGYARLS